MSTWLIGSMIAALHQIRVLSIWWRLLESVWPLVCSFAWESEILSIFISAMFLIEAWN